MSMTDPIADLLTRIRNAQRAGLDKVEIPSSKVKVAVAELLTGEGFVGEVSTRKDGVRSILTVALKYDNLKRPVISEIKRLSRPGLRRYCKHTEIPKVMNGLGIAVLSTSKGVMVDREARKAHLGGELIATVW
jgi:small subunit ribosomal protein S8